MTPAERDARRVHAALDRLARLPGVAPLARRLRPRRRAAAAGAALQRWRADAPARRWRRAVVWASRAPIRFETLAGTVDTEATPVVMCLWKRSDRLSHILRDLSAQQDVRVRLVLWNNDATQSARYRRIVAQHGATGALSSVEFRSSPVNVGGLGRFLALRRLTGGVPGRPFLMIDDDQQVGATFVRDLLSRFRPRSYIGFWAWNLGASYWQRVEAADGETVNYVGTGGSVCDQEIVADRRFFSRLPARYGFIEDLWASAFAAARGWELRRVDAEVVFHDHDGNMYHDMIGIKDEFYWFLTSEDGARLLSR